MKSVIAALSLNAVLTDTMTSSGLVQAKKSRQEALMFYLVHEDGNESPLLEVLEDLDRHFETTESLAYPASFEYPRSYQYELTYTQVANTGSLYKMRVFEGS
jgi:hypothetical protein